MSKSLEDWMKFLNISGGIINFGMHVKLGNEWVDDRILCYPTLLLPKSIINFFKNTDNKNELQLCEDALKILELSGFQCVSWEIPDIYKEFWNVKDNFKDENEYIISKYVDRVLYVPKFPPDIRIDIDERKTIPSFAALEKARNNFEIQKKLIVDNIFFILNNFWRSKISALHKCNRADIRQKKGKSEDLLFIELFNLYPDFIKIDMQLSGYYPDIVLNICDIVFIDIEIDEPYDLINKNELHYIGCNDEKRDEYFTNNNWFVLRFSERQILNNLVDCIALIKKLVDFIIGKSEYLDFTESDEKEGIIHIKWSKEEARMMKILNQREKEYK